MAQVLHKVQEGETILSVCLAWGITYEEFMSMNPDFDPMGSRYAGELRVGERIVIGDSKRVLDKLRIDERRRIK